MAEPINSAFAVSLWEFVVKPIVDSIKKEYGDKTKEVIKTKLKDFFERIKMSSEDKKLIEIEIVKADDDVLSNKDKFVEYFTKKDSIGYINAKYHIEIINVDEGGVVNFS